MSLQLIPALLLAAAVLVAVGINASGASSQSLKLIRFFFLGSFLVALLLDRGVLSEFILTNSGGGGSLLSNISPQCLVASSCPLLAS